MKNILAVIFIIFAYPQTFENVNSWAYQLQNLDPNEVSQNNTFDMIVMDYSVSGSDDDAYSTEDIQLIKNSNKLAICYISIGEAEDYRSYWQSAWSSNPPDWLGAENPDWEGNFKVKFWNSEWQNIIFDWLDTIIAQGFDGIYLDIIDAYYYWMEEVPNSQQEPYAAVYMIDFVENIRNYLTENGGENMVIIPQNGEYIVWENNVTENDIQRYLSTCDAIGVEDLFFYGNQDINNSYNPDEERLELLIDVYQPAGWPVFSIEYLTHQNKITQYLQVAGENNFIPYCSMRELDVLTDGFEPSEPVTFKVTLHNLQQTEENIYFVQTLNDELIQQCREQLDLPEEQRSWHINGELEFGNGGFNSPWNWHIIPNEWQLAEMSIELCDGNPINVENDLDYWINSVGSFCSWNSFILEEIPPFQLGDVNFDDTINVLDITLIVNYVLGIEPETQNADMNNDEVINIIDIILIVNIIIE